MAQTITYGGESTVAVDGVFRELLDPEQWSPGDWYVELTVDSGDGHVQVDGWLVDFVRFEQRGCWVTIQGGSPEEGPTGIRMRIETETIVHLEIP